LDESETHMSHLDLQPGFDFQQAGKEVLEIEREGLAQLDQYINDDFVKACELMFYCSGKVVVRGMGKSGHIGKKMAATFASTGTPAFFVHPGEASHGDLGMVTAQDVVIAISNSGESNEILALIPVLKRLRVPMICITSRPESAMAKAADIHLCSFTESARFHRRRFCAFASRRRAGPQIIVTRQRYHAHRG